MFPLKTSFTAGELTPHLYGRVDLNQYNLGARQMKNFFCHAHGGVSNRPGTLFICECPQPQGGIAEIHRLIPFQFSTEQGYILEFSHELIRVIKDGVLVEDGGAPVEIISPYYGNHLAEIDYAQSADVLFLVHRYHPPMKLSRTSDVDWTLEAVEFIDGPYLSRQPGDEQIALTPSGALGEVTLTASADFFNDTMVDRPLRLGYPDDEDPTIVSWSVAMITAVSDARTATADIEKSLGFDLIYNGDFETGMGGWEDWSRDNIESGVSGSVAYNAAEQAVELTNNVGIIIQILDYYPPSTELQVTLDFQFITLNNPEQGVIGPAVAEYDVLKTNDWDKYYLTGTVAGSGTYGTTRSTASWTFKTPKAGKDLALSVNGAFGDNLNGDNMVRLYSVSITRPDFETNEWRKFAWGPHNQGDELGYPRCITFFEQRMCFANSYAHPQSVWMSRTGDFYDFGFTTPGQDDDGIGYMLASRKINDIHWMAAAGDLIIGTSSNVWKISAGGQTDVVTPTSITARVQSGDGCAAMAPLWIGNAMLFVQRGGRSVRGLAYSLESDSFQSRDISVMAAHLFETRRIVSWDFASLHDSLVWCVGDDGVLLGLTYMPDHEVTGWHQHDTGYDAGYAQDEFADVCVLPGTESDDVYFLVKRTYRGGASLEQRYYVEKLMPRITLDKGVVINEREGIERLGQPYNYFFVDCGVIYQGAAETNILGLDHLEGYTVAILADGSVLPSQTVTNGIVVLAHAAETVIVGLPYESWLETLDLELADDQGTGQGRIKVVNRVTLKVHRTRGGEAGPRGVDQWDRIDQLRVRDVWDQQDPTALRTGNLDLVINSGWEQTGGLTIRNRDPLPVTILAVIPEVQLAER
jgi:hypothetical protein